MRNLIILFITIIILISCNNSKNVKSTNVNSISSNVETVEYIKSLEFSSPANHAKIKMNTKISLSLNLKKGEKADSIDIFLSGNKIKTLYKAPYSFNYSFKNCTVGKTSLKAIAYHKDNKQGLTVRYLTIFPSKAPKRHSFKVIKTYKHNTNDYTQGLVFHNGYMYEGTGGTGHSCIKKIDLDEGNKEISVLDINPELFGEGITVYKDKIIQLTWTSGKGFVYDIKTFSLEYEFNYSTQGWGITTIGDKLIMSDGSNKLYTINPDSFQEEKEIEVYDNKGPVEKLNELEYINGKIYANVWMTDRIVIINPNTGVVEGDIYLPNLLSAREKSQLASKECVLNGIAYDSKTKRIFITGKKWPKLFHISIK